MARRRVWVQVAVVTATAAAVLGAVVAGLLGATASAVGEPWTAARALRQWALWSAVSSPVAFVVGGVVFAIARSVWRGWRGATSRGAGERVERGP